jgi:hypothetical protein
MRRTFNGFVAQREKEQLRKRRVIQRISRKERREVAFIGSVGLNRAGIIEC